MKTITYVFGRGNWFISVFAGIVFSFMFLFFIPIIAVLLIFCACVTFFLGFCGLIKQDDSEIYAGYDGGR